MFTCHLLGAKRLAELLVLQVVALCLLMSGQPQLVPREIFRYPEGELELNWTEQRGCRGHYMD